MNKITRRARELSTARVKVKRLSMYPFDINFKLRPTRQRLKFRGKMEGFTLRTRNTKNKREW